MKVDGMESWSVTTFPISTTERIYLGGRLESIAQKLNSPTVLRVGEILTISENIPYVDAVSWCEPAESPP